MHIHHFKIDEAARDGSTRFHHLRRFLTIYWGTEADQNNPDWNEREGTLFKGHIETVVGKIVPELSLRFHVGTRGSETPFDVSCVIAGTGFYAGTENGRALADRLTAEKIHKYEGRDISFRVFEGRAYWHLWTHPNERERGEFAKWREGSTLVNLADRLFGEARYSYEDLEVKLLAIDMPEGIYPVRATLQRCTHKRPRSKRSVITYTLDVDAPAGIPSHYDKSDGWKGDRTYGFGVKFPNRAGLDWHLDGVNAIKAWVYDRRARSGFTAPQEPALIQNG